MKVENGVLLEVTNEDIIDGRFNFPEGVTSIGDSAFWGCRSFSNRTSRRSNKHRR